MKLNIPEMLQQAKKVQDEFERIKQEINQKTVSAESGGGMVTVTMTGANELISLKISPELLESGDLAMLEDLIIAAVNIASKAAQDLASEEMRKVSGILPNIPGLNLNL